MLTGEAGRPVEIADLRSVGGGCINPSARLETGEGAAYFLKWNARHPGLFVPEADGLRALASSEAVRVPRVVGVKDGGEDDPGWLLLEYVPRGSSGPGYGRRLGRELAALHRNRSDAWGWPSDNFIGSLPQPNRRRATWAEFWAEERLQPQLARARASGHRPGTEEAWAELFSRIEELVGPAGDEGASLLHGDLWSGNVYPDTRGAPVLVDPAVYRGHREVDLAMTELFGGFPSSFLDAYRESWPLAPGYEEGRRALYQLYPLLVHVNLFGGSYVAATGRALRDALG
ncbi:MAG: phosphotransferase [Gemmatimonadetes bacterium]|nr:fructosamine kinase family protein [Gemmatimonadota bacterium]NIR80229.1 fructosamine kinase family protein [Gemmatimonadota bacterium]NIT86758.1 fructosamine kinase family protein [Gemmatimonadota bacterium]NIU30626.1 fructosamine kinase family protein [Gemmatimonadota bacterium]NIU35434.1 phosphotransferase [Gemmatimonadota bacterium]